MKTLAQQAEAYATHAKDCTCKGAHFSQDQHDAFLAGARATLEMPEVKAMREALDSFEYTHHTHEAHCYAFQTTQASDCNCEVSLVRRTLAAFDRLKESADV